MLISFSPEEKNIVSVSDTLFGVFIKAGEVRADQSKMVAIKEWPKPTMVTAMWGF